MGIWSYHHYVELLVVADFKMKLYHGANLENYVLTLLSIVIKKIHNRQNINILIYLSI